jgi:hypothetical protein
MKNYSDNASEALMVSALKRYSYVLKTLSNPSRVNFKRALSLFKVSW